MKDEEKNLISKQQTNELYTSIGKFAVHFEHICQELRSGIIWMLHEHGLTNQQITCILLHDLTAFPLQSIFQSLIAETVDLSVKSKQIIKNIMKRCQDLTEKRNNLIHNAWFIGWASPEQIDFSETTAMKPHRNKHGGGFKVFKITSDEIQKLINDAIELTILTNRLWICITNKFEIENNFFINEESNAQTQSFKK